MENPLSENLLLLGKVLRPHGLEGVLRIQSYAHSEASFLDAGTISLRTPDGRYREYDVVSVKIHGNIHLMELDGLNTVEAAEIYRGADILVKKESLPPKADEEYFWYELIGLRVFLKTGRYLGEIKQILPTGGSDIYVVREGKREYLIPATHEVVEEIDPIEKKMIIAHMEGLLDLNEV